VKALLLAAGYGTRLKPLTNIVPKCLIEINGKELLCYWLELLEKNNITNILINTHYLSEKVENFINNSVYNLNITLVYEKELLNTAGTLIENYEFFENEDILLIHADNYSKFEFEKFVDTFIYRQKNIDITMMTFTTDNPQSSGIVELNELGIVTNFHEKKLKFHGNIANGAVYIISNSVLKFLVNNKNIYKDFSNDVIPVYLNKINTFHNKNIHIDIGTIENLKKARRYEINIKD